MKIAKLFLTGMYVHLALSIVTPIGILFTREWDIFSYALLFFYLFMIVVLQVIGWICVGSAVNVYRKGDSEKLRKSLKILKIYAIPFYVLNFALSVVVWGIIFTASRGIMFFLLPIPVIVTCLMIFQSGCVGICYVMYLRKQPENQGKPSGIHYVMQIISVLDVISTILIFRKYAVTKEETGEKTED